jgi:SAM-dependent methyltransferase
VADKTPRIGDIAEGACPLCGQRGTVHAKAKDVEYFTTDRTFDYCHCETCDILYVHPMLSSELSMIYPANYYSFAVPDRRNLAVAVKEWLDARAFAKLLRRLPGQRLAVLDIGGGRGWMASLLRHLDSRIEVTQIVDIDPAARVPAERSGHRYFCGRIEEFESAERFDLILMLNLIEHVAEPHTVLNKARELLADHGIVYLKTPNFRSLDARLFRHRNWGGYHCPRHFVLFCRDSIERTAGRARLDVVSFRYTQGAPFWGVSLFEMLRRWGVVAASAERPAHCHPLMPLLQALGAAFDFARRPISRLSQMIVILSKGNPRDGRQSGGRNARG